MKPEPGITLEVTATDDPDGDTISVEVKRTFNVRVRDFLCAEKKTEKGKIEKAFAKELLTKNPKLTIFIPTHHDEKLLDFLSFERVLADVWLDDGRRYDDVMEENGMGRKLLPGEKPHMGE